MKNYKRPALKRLTVLIRDPVTAYNALAEICRGIDQTDYRHRRYLNHVAGLKNKLAGLGLDTLVSLTEKQHSTLKLALKESPRG